MDGVAKMMLNDFMRGKIPWFTPPPHDSDKNGEVKAGRQGKLGEMPLKRKAAALDDAEAQIQQEAAVAEGDSKLEGDDEKDDSFEGFGSDTEGALSRKPSFGATTAGDSNDDSEAEAAEGDDVDDVLSMGSSEDEDEDDAGEAAPVVEQISARKPVTRSSKRTKR